MGKIIKLDDALSNKIAAGEVVERPASIVKELVENALDANSTKIVIKVEEGGLEKIQIIDNGDGIESDDVETAFLRHATSKIHNEKDLFQIRTLGFRGEALPSIASVSFVEMTTSTGTGAGVSLFLEGGRIVKKELAKSRKGTSVTVTNLFYNTPARLKHLKTVHTELGNISDVVNRLALAHPDVSFRLFHQDKELLYTSGNGNQLQVISQIYGRSVAQQMIPIKNQSIDFALSGYIAKPEINRASRQYISFFINGRFIRNYQLSRAIIDGYHTLLPIGRYPIVVLNIQMDPTLVDVNVHPAKLEARISKEEELFALIKDTIKAAFQQIQLIPLGEKPKMLKQQSEQLSFDFSFKPMESKYTESVVVKDPPSEIVQEEREPVVSYYEAPSSVEEEIEEEEITVEKQVKERIPPLYPIGQLHGTYILAQNEQGLYIIDQHAAQERINYEYYREKVGQVTNELQDLIVPLTFEFTHAEKMIIEEHMHLLQEVGVFLEPFGINSFIIRSHPVWLPKGQEAETLKEIVDQVIAEKKVDIKKLREDAAILMSCKRAIKANRHLRQDEIVTLLETLRTCEDPFTCPHGRPIMIHYSTYEIEKMFKRIM